MKTFKKIGEAYLRKHTPGGKKHDQSRHGRGGPVTAKPAFSFDVRIPSGRLVFANTLPVEREKDWYINEKQERLNEALDTAKKNAIYVQTHNGSVNVWSAPDGRIALTSYGINEDFESADHYYWEKSELNQARKFLDYAKEHGFRLVGDIDCGVWRVEAGDAEKYKGQGEFEVETGKAVRVRSYEHGGNGVFALIDPIDEENVREKEYTRNVDDDFRLGFPTRKPAVPRVRAMSEIFNEYDQEMGVKMERPIMVHMGEDALEPDFYGEEDYQAYKKNPKHLKSATAKLEAFIRSEMDAGRIKPSKSFSLKIPDSNEREHNMRRTNPEYMKLMGWEYEEENPG